MSKIYRVCILALCAAALLAVSRSQAANCTYGCKLIENYLGTSTCFGFDPVACSIISLLTVAWLLDSFQLAA